MAAPPRRVAVVGSGCSGLAAAYELSCRGVEVTVFESADHVGGHACTLQVEGVPVDVGFMVCNRVTYPNMVRCSQQNKQKATQQPGGICSRLAADAPPPAVASHTSP
jgi:predicted NAD/FAD-binding protein